jgi:hypothetical protein
VACLFVLGDADALAALVRETARDPTALAPLGLAALEAARSITHQQMHRLRHALIAQALAARALA